MIKEEVSLKGVHIFMWTKEKKVFTTEVAGKPFSIEIGEVAKQSNGACMVHYGDTSVLSTATASDEPKDLPFFPLTVNYEERLYRSEERRVGKDSRLRLPLDQDEDAIRDRHVTGVQTCALPICFHNRGCWQTLFD